VAVIVDVLIFGTQQEKVFSYQFMFALVLSE